MIKNTHNAKALLQISPIRTSSMFSKMHPGSIFNFNITEKTDMIRWAEEEHKIV